VEKEELSKENEKLKTELGDSLESLTHQYRSGLEFMEELRTYIKEYVEKEEKGQESIMNVKVEQMKELVEMQYKSQFSDLQATLDETNAVNSQLREEAEALSERMA